MEDFVIIRWNLSSE